MNGMQPQGFPMPMPMFIGMHDQYRLPEVTVPARVNKALEFIRACTLKTMPGAAVNPMSIEVIPGERLTDEEASAHASACNLLSAYFAGKLPLDEFEKSRLGAEQKALDKDRKGTLIACPNCGGQRGNASCQLCRGNGGALITPLGD